MPMIDFYCPEGALDGEARAAALEKMTEALLRCEGAPETSVRGRCPGASSTSFHARR
jgi:phenylpyruvate tautomerase PptA (4-oxalocrotonate tautomerase family)